MAGPGYSGYFMKGLASGLTSGVNLGTQLTQLKWQKQKQKELNDLNTKMNDAWSTIGQEIVTLANDGQLSDDDKLKIYTMTMAAPREMQSVMQNIRSSLSQFDTKGLENQMEYVKTFYEYAQGLDPKDINSLYETVRNYITDPHALTLFEVADKKLRHEYEATKAEPTTEVFPSLETARAKYPEAKIEFNTQAGGYVVGAGEVKPTAPAELSAKDNWAIENYKAGKINFNELSKYMGTYIAPEEMSTKEKEIELMKQYGATNEEIKNKLLGIGIEEPTPPTAPAIENVREDIKDADTVEDARRIEKNHIAKYGDTLGISDVDKFWAEGQTIYLDKIKTAIGNIVDEKGWLKKGTITSAEVGLDFEGDQPVEEIYKKLYAEYIKYREMLEKMGVDLTEFPELKPLEEIEKVGLGEGFWGFGKQRGQYKSIYK